jgi:hypothetical protein
MLGKLAAIAGVAAMAVTALGATAASASTGPGARSSGGNAPSSSSRNTYINEHGSDGNSRVKFLPRTFDLVSGVGYDIFQSPTSWFGSNAAEGHMHAISTDGHRSYVGNVSDVFSHRLCNAHFIGTGRNYCYYENVRLYGIRPGNGGSVQNWHWSWRADNWVNNR